MKRALDFEPTERPKGILLALAVVSILLLTSQRVSSDTLNPSRVQHLSVGVAQGFAASARLDSQRTGTSSASFPTAPSLLWRKAVGATDLTPLVSRDESITIALASGDLLRLDKDGREVFRIHLPGGAPAVPPLPLVNGNTVALAANGLMSHISPDGKLISSQRTPVRNCDQPLLATSDGSFAAASGRIVTTFFQDGNTREVSTLPMRVVAPLVESRNGILALLDDGHVYRISQPLPPRRLGSFGAAVDGFVLVSERTLLGAAGAQILALDLETGIASVRFTVPSGAAVERPIAATAALAFAASSDGQLFVIDKDGLDVARATLERPSPSASPSAPVFTMTPSQPVPVVSGPPLVADRHNNVAFLRNSGRAGVVLLDTPPQEGRERQALAGKTILISDIACQTPLAILPAGPRRLLVACREGNIALFADREGEPSPE